ncbi:glycosyltransferase [Fusobacterium ulcerans]|uniref:glycosyltransferase n=1 Tax=Fusobacterium ulcerans TaxID=861 RepID=UPI00103281F5|nr:glycosyltransferase [Fusobacterium ulcerans]
MKEINLTIAVAIYNIEKYLPKCLESLLNQSVKNDYEILLINDGSTDESLKICEEFLKKGLKAEIVTKKNEGLSSVRNLAANKAKGKYIFFIDGDDWIEKNTIETIFSNIKGFDMLIFGFNWIFAEKLTVDLRFQKDEIFDKNIENEIFRNNINTAVWNKVFKREIIIKNNLKFPELKGAEDYLFIYEYLLRCQKVKKISISLYNYNQRENSLSNEKKEYYYLNTLKVYEELIKRNKKQDIYFIKYILENYVYLIREYNKKLKNIEIEELRKNIENFLKIKKIVFNKEIRLKTKIRYLKLKKVGFNNEII